MSFSVFGGPWNVRQEFSTRFSTPLDLGCRRVTREPRRSQGSASFIFPFIPRVVQLEAGDECGRYPRAFSLHFRSRLDRCGGSVRGCKTSAASLGHCCGLTLTRLPSHGPVEGPGLPQLWACVLWIRLHCLTLQGSLAVTPLHVSRADSGARKALGPAMQTCPGTGILILRLLLSVTAKQSPVYQAHHAGW